jgi:hypothetical protein
MLDRRSFLHASLVGIGTSSLANANGAILTDYERVVAGNLDRLGIPPSWSLVRECLHPFVPERVMILSRPRDRCKKQNSGLRLPREKFDLLMAVTDRLANFYERPDLRDQWGRRLVRREELGSSALGQGVGLVHQFQGPEFVLTSNGLVDWWAFLLPDGAEFDSLDDKPVYALIGHVFSQRHPGRELAVWCITSGLFYTIGNGIGWTTISQMDRLAAARCLNLEIARRLREEETGMVHNEASVRLSKPIPSMSDFRTCPLPAGRSRPPRLVLAPFC